MSEAQRERDKAPVVIDAAGPAARAAATLLVCAALLGGCNPVGPDFRAPQAPASNAWTAPMDGGLRASSGDLASWWSLLGDAHLDDLIRRAMDGNTDKKSAVARVREARARRAEAGGELYPSVDTSVTYERRRSAGGGNSPSASLLGADTFSAGFDASWELDIFGGKRRNIEQRQAELEASRDNLGNVMVTVLAEVARNYVEYRSLQARIGIAQSNVASQSATLELVQLRRDAGLSDELEVAQARYNLADTESRIPPLQTSLAAAGNRLAVLLGVPAGSLDAELAEAAPVPAVPPAVTVGMAADLLRRRPDVAEAEQNVVAANAAIGVATAELYPKLTLTGSIGLSALDLADFGSAASRTFAIGPSIQWNVFDAGRIRARIEASSALEEQVLAAYEGAVLQAYEEAENAMVAFVREQIRRDSLGQGTASARIAASLARTKYEQGVIDFQQVLDAQRAQLGFEESLAQSSAAVTTNLIALYKALGGGWDPADTVDAGRPGPPATAPAAPKAPPA